MRFKNRVIRVDQTGEAAIAEIETPDGNYELPAEYLIACDGARSPIRTMMGLDFVGELFEERFLIADIEMEAETPPEPTLWRR